MKDYHLKYLLPLSDMATGRCIYNKYKDLQKLQYLNLEQLQQLQIKSLNSVITFAKEKTNYNQRALKQIDKIQNFNDLEKIPILTKSVLNSRPIEDFLYGSPNNYIKEGTSGSSGIQGFFFFDKAAQSYTYAAELLFFSWAGFSLGNPHLQTGMTIKRGIVKKTKDFLFNCNYQPAFNLTSEKLINIISIIKIKKLRHIIGYASSIYHIAKISLEKGYSLNLKSVISLGDNLYPHYRSTIEEAFNCKVFDTYGCCEGFMIGGQCEEGNYHVPMPLNILEIVDEDGKQLPDGEMGRVVLTRLDKNPMPLIRYDLGDLAIKSKLNKCPCGRGYEIIEKIIGRNTDIVITPNGHKLIVHYFTRIFENVPEIKQFEVYQEIKSKIIINFIPSQDFKPNILDNIKSQILKDCNNDLEVQFQEVSTIKPSPSGKSRLIISKLNSNPNVY